MVAETNERTNVRTRERTDKCTLETHPELFGCCCVCKHHVKDYGHPDTDGKMFKPRGWVCVGFLACGEDMVFSGWFEHGMCELFDRATAPPPIGGEK